MKKAYEHLASELSAELLSEAREKGYTMPMLSLYIGKEPKTLYNIASDPSKYLSLPAFLGGLTVVEAKRTLQKIAHLLNCEVVELPEVDPCNPFNPKEAARIMKEVAEFLEAHAEAIDDDEISPREKERLSKEGWEAVRAVLRMLKAIERV